MGSEKRFFCLQNFVVATTKFCKPLGSIDQSFSRSGGVEVTRGWGNLVGEAFAGLASARRFSTVAR